MKRVGLYVRVSTDLQAKEQEGSLKTQQQLLTEEVEKRNAQDGAWAIAKTYIEKGVSGKDVRRQKFQEMLRDIKSGIINAVICTELSRVSRSVLDFLKFAEFLKRYDTEFICLKQKFDTTNAYGKILVTVSMALAEFERELTSERTKSSFLARAERGLWNGGNLYGYDLDENKKGYLKVNDDEKLVVNLIFEKYLKFGSILKVVGFLKEKGYRLKSFTSRREVFHPANEFDYNAVRYILENPAYIGLREVNKKKKSKNQEELPEQLRYRIVKAMWPAIVPEENFKKVQELIEKNYAGNSNNVQKDSYYFLLDELLICNSCGAFLRGGSGTGKGNKMHYYYRHWNGKRKRDCGLPYIPASAIEKLVIERLEFISKNQKLFDEIIAKANTKLKRTLPQKQKLLKKKNKDLADVASRADALVERMIQMPKNKVNEFVTEKLNRLSTEKSQTENEIVEIQAEIKEIENNVISSKELREALLSFNTLFGELQPHKQKELLRCIIKEIRISNTEMKTRLVGTDLDIGMLNEYNDSGQELLNNFDQGLEPLLTRGAKPF